MNHPFDPLDIPGLPGRLIFTPCPGTRGASLQESLATLQQAGATGVISLMPQAELEVNDAGRIAAQCQALGLDWHHLPVADEQAPRADFDAAWQQASGPILAALRAGQSLAIHCKGGSGRTGLIAARILIEAGVPLEPAIARVQALRPKAIRHPAHLAWINACEATPG